MRKCSTSYMKASEILPCAPESISDTPRNRAVYFQSQKATLHNSASETSMLLWRKPALKDIQGYIFFASPRSICVFSLKKTGLSMSAYLAPSSGTAEGGGVHTKVLQRRRGQPVV